MASTFNLADLFEAVADTDPSREVVVTPARRLTFAELDERANRLANHLAAKGFGAGDHLGLQIENGTEYVEGMLAAFKLRAVPINVNFRYVEDELRYLFQDADLKAVVVGERFSPAVAAIASGLPKLRTTLVVGDPSTPGLPDPVNYEDALAAASPERPAVARSADDHYIAYTGGTTGMPKGVVWRHEDIFFAAMGGGDPFRMLGPIAEPDQIRERVAEQPVVSLVVPPLMHVSGHWSAMMNLLGGNKTVLPSPGAFDPEEIWQLIRSEGVSLVTIVGDAMARPLADTLERSGEEPPPTLFVIGSGGAVLSPSTKERLARLLPNVIVVDGFGSSETGVVAGAAGGTDTTGPTMAIGPDLQVFDDDGAPVVPGSDTVGVVARSGYIPVGYYGDEVKTKATFVEIDGRRWSMPGDRATVAEDGTIQLLGRGSVSINTGGEKVFPEEVEAVVKGHPGIVDAVIVGVPDDRWGERVTAVVSTADGTPVDLEALQGTCRGKLASYKVPRAVVQVPTIERLPNGKTDYGWAKGQALAAEAAT